MIGGLAETVVGAGGVAADYGPVPVVLFYVFAAMTVGAGFSVALARNIVRAAVGLLFALVGMSGLYFLLHAEYLAAVQLVVYVGGTLILIVFGVMLTSKSPTTNYDAKRYEVVWAVVIGVLLVVPLGWLMLAARWHGVSAAGGVAGNLEPVGEVGAYSIKQLGRGLLDPQGYLVPFELVSVLLLAVMIGAAYLAKSRRPAGPVAAAVPPSVLQNTREPDGSTPPPVPPAAPVPPTAGGVA